MLRLFPSLMLLAALGGCTALPPSTAGVAVHDFGPLEAATLAPVGVPLRNVEVVPAPWLASNVMAYRLAYAQSTRRQAFKHNWSSWCSSAPCAPAIRRPLPAAAGCVWTWMNSPSVSIHHRPVGA